MLGKPRAFVHFFVFVAILGLILAIGSRTLDSAIAFIGLGFFIVGSIIAVRRSWKEREDPKATTIPSAISVLPKKWQKWVLGEDDDGR